MLLEFGCPVNGKDNKGYTPLFHAVKYGSLAVAIQLIENGADVNHVSDTEIQKTPLFRARSYEIVKYLIQKGASPIYKKKRSEEKINAIAYLMDHNPEAARAIFDNCLGIANDSNLIIDFSLFDSNGEDESKDEMILLDKAEKQSRLPYIEDQNLKKLIVLHPLLQIFLNLKFKTIRLQFWLLLMFQILFVITLTTIGVMYVQFTACEITDLDNSTGDLCFTNRYLDWLEDESLRKICANHEVWSLTCNKTITIANNGSALEQLCKIYYQDDEVTIHSCWTFHWFSVVTMVVLFIHFLKECGEFFAKESKISYIFSLENLLELFILMCAVFFMVVSHTDIEWAYHASAWMIFFVWINLVLYLGRISLIGKYIFMSLYVIRILFLCLIAYLPVFFAFTFGYYVLLQANETFNGYIRGFISVLAMMIDEIGYGQFDYKEVTVKGGLNGSTQVLTLFFMVFVSLILMNLLIAVTINNTDILNYQSRISISKRKIIQLDEVLKFRKWSILRGFKYIPKLKNIGLQVFKKEDNFKLVSLGVI